MAHRVHFVFSSGRWVSSGYDDPDRNCLAPVGLMVSSTDLLTTPTASRWKVIQ